MVYEDKNYTNIKIVYETPASDAYLVAETKIKYFKSYFDYYLAISLVNCWKLK